MPAKQVIGGPLEIDGRVLSLSKAVRARNFVFVTGQVPTRSALVGDFPIDIRVEIDGIAWRPL